MRRSFILMLVVVVALGIGVWSLASDEYRASVVLPSATNLVEDGRVLVNGFVAGEIAAIEVRDGKAHVDLALDSEFAPLHDGAVVEVEWRGLVGERQVNVTDGDGANAEIPDGGMVKGRMPKPMELDQILAALDPKTRTRLSSLIRRLEGTVTGNEKDLRATLKASGPALAALGDVLRGVGADGPAIKQLVSRLNGMVKTLAARDDEIREVVGGLSKVTAQTAAQREKVAGTLKKLPGTLHTATRTLGKVPGVADKVTPLLDELRPASERLPGVARNLAPVLRDLRPLVRELRPTLGAADELLDRTPALLDSAHPTLTGLNTTVSSLLPVVEFLRPYTPEAIAFMGNWGSSFGNYDSNGHYARLNASVGGRSAHVSPGTLPPGYQKRPYPYPGEAGNQPWTDAYGSGVQ